MGVFHAFYDSFLTNFPVGRSVTRRASDHFSYSQWWCTFDRTLPNITNKCMYPYIHMCTHISFQTSACELRKTLYLLPVPWKKVWVLIMPPSLMCTGIHHSLLLRLPLKSWSLIYHAPKLTYYIHYTCYVRCVYIYILYIDNTHNVALVNYIYEL